MNESNKIIKSFWIGKELSNLEKLSIHSFLKQGHDYHLYVYDDVPGIPENVIIKDANTIIPEKYFFLGERSGKSIGGVTTFADLFRYILLYKHGGWWVDADVVCLRPFDFQQEYVFSSEMKPKGSPAPINTVMKVPRGCMEIKYCLDECIKKDIINTQFCEIGPDLLHHMVRRYKRDFSVKNWHVFCPIPYWELYKLFYPNYYFHVTKDVYSIHFWNDSMYYLGYDKNAIYNKDSIFEQLKSYYTIPRLH